MKLYKTAIIYTVVCITDKKVDKEHILLLKKNMDEVIGRQDMVRNDGKIETISKEFIV